MQFILTQFEYNDDDYDDDGGGDNQNSQHEIQENNANRQYYKSVDRNEKRSIHLHKQQSSAFLTEVYVIYAC